MGACEGEEDEAEVESAGTSRSLSSSPRLRPNTAVARLFSPLLVACVGVGALALALACAGEAAEGAGGDFLSARLLLTFRPDNPLVTLEVEDDVGVASILGFFFTPATAVSGLAELVDVAGVVDLDAPPLPLPLPTLLPVRAADREDGTPPLARLLRLVLRPVAPPLALLLVSTERDMVVCLVCVVWR